MLISQPALAYLEAAWRQLRGVTTETESDEGSGLGPAVDRAAGDVEWWLRPWDGTSKTRDTESRSGTSTPTQAMNHADGELRGQALSADERRARAAVLRASLLARQRRHVEAAKAFDEALALDPTIDLTEAPHFWDLERAAHRAAADAYEAVGRTRDAMTLRGRIDLRFRPRLVRGV